MSFCVRLINLALLFIFFAITVSASGQFYVCGQVTVKQEYFQAAEAEGCSRYFGNGVCTGINCFKPNSFPPQYRGNHFPASDGIKIMWPVKVRKGFRKTKVGFVVMDITEEKCFLVGIIYRLKNSSFAACAGPYTEDSLKKVAELDRSGSSSRSGSRPGSRSGSRRQDKASSVFFETPGGTILTPR